jgi:hypothetical protein
MRVLIYCLIFFSLQAKAFTLNNNFGAAFDSNRVKVLIASDTVCPNAGVTVNELAEMVEPAVNNFWNKVPTSSLKLIPDGFADPIGTDINTDRLCSPTDEDCINNATDPLIPPVSNIIIACNSNDKNFGGPGATNVLAVTVPNHFKGKNIAGAVILINDFSSIFSTLSRSDQISVLAHEIGHAIGLGHAENKNSEALMYYKTINLRRSLAQDDIDGVSYLYPEKIDGCGLFSGTTINPNTPKGPSFWPMWLTMGLIILIGEVLKLLRRPTNTGATA